MYDIRIEEDTINRFHCGNQGIVEGGIEVLKDASRELYKQEFVQLIRGMLILVTEIYAWNDDLDKLLLFQHLNDLLNTRDIDILEATLRLILRPAQRMSNQRSLRTNFNISQERILDLVHGWGT